MSKLEDAAHSKANPVYMKTFSELKEAAQEKHGSGSKWIGALAAQIAGRQEGVKAKEDKPYLAARRAIERHEKGQYKDFTKDYKSKMEKAGKEADPVSWTPKGDVTIKIVGRTDGSKHEGSRTRSFETTFKGPDAYTFVNNPTVRDILINEYGPDDAIVDNLGEGGAYELEVTYAV